MKKIYLDYAATTPVDSRVVRAMKPYFTGQFGNPGSLHSFGQEASAAVFSARQSVARALGCNYQEVIFTGSATEANNLALRGSVRNFWWNFFKENGKKMPVNIVPHIIVSAVEHESILETVKDIEQRGAARVTYVPVDSKGIVSRKAIQKALCPETVLVSIMYANNETGVIQPISAIANMIREFRGNKKYPLIHSDAVQAFNYLDCNVEKLGLDMVTISSQKIYGPKGVGMLYVRSKKIGVTREFPISPWLTGGGQEQGLRSGTENVPAIVGFAKAVELSESLREKETKRLGELREHAWKGIKKIFPGAQLNGSLKDRLPNNLNFYVPKVSGEQTLVALDLQGIAISSGSACTARSTNPSHVLLAMGFDKVRAKNSLRVTLGRPTTKQEIDSFVKAFATLKRHNI